MKLSHFELQEKYKSYKARKYFENLNGLRFICILMVLWHHNQIVTFLGSDLLDRGFMGVDFFFVLSGFLITTLLLREEARYGSFSMKNFYLRRIIRIVPVYFFVVSMVSLYYIIVKGQYHLAELLPFYYLFLSNFLVEHIPLLTITWSLSVEEQFYVIWPVLLMLLPRDWIIPALSALVVLNVAGGLNINGAESPELWPLEFSLPNSTYAPILMGAMSAIVLDRRNFFIEIYPFLGRKYSSLFLFFALILTLQLAPSDVRGWPNLAIHSLMTLIVMSLVVREDMALTTFLTSRVVARIGSVSYGIYLYHLIALDLVNRIFPTGGTVISLFSFVAYVLVAWVISEVSFRTLEAFFYRFRPQRKAEQVDPKVLEVSR